LGVTKRQSGCGMFSEQTCDAKKISNLNLKSHPSTSSKIIAYTRTDGQSDRMMVIKNILYGVGDASFCLLLTFPEYTIPFYSISNGY